MEITSKPAPGRDPNAKLYQNAGGQWVEFAALSPQAQREVTHRAQYHDRVAQLVAYGISERDALLIANFGRSLAELCGLLDEGRREGCPPLEMALALGLEEPRTVAGVPIRAWGGTTFATREVSFGPPIAGNRGAVWARRGLSIPQAVRASARFEALRAEFPSAPDLEDRAADAARAV